MPDMESGDRQGDIGFFGIGFFAPAWRAKAANSKRGGRCIEAPRRRVIALVLCIGGLTAAAALAIHVQPKLPPPAGPFLVGTVEWEQGSREKSAVMFDAHSCGITTQLWYPAEPGTGSGRAPYNPGKTNLLSAQRWVTTSAALGAQVATMQPRYPVLLYFPSWDGNRVAHTAIVQDLASRGFVVAAVGYDFEDCARPDLESASSLTTDMDFSSAAAFKWTVQVADTKIVRVASSATRVIDKLKELDRYDRQGRFTGRLDLSHIAAIGHSLGGAIALQIAWLDPRIRAVIDLDGWVFDAAPGSWIKQPFLVIGSDGPPAVRDDAAKAEPQRRYNSILDEETEHRLHDAFAKYGGVEMMIGASRHEDFTDSPYLSRIAAIFDHRPDGHVVRVAVDCAVTFLESVFSGQTLSSCETAHGKVQIVVWPRPSFGELAN